MGQALSFRDCLWRFKYAIIAVLLFVLIYQNRHRQIPPHLNPSKYLPKDFNFNWSGNELEFVEQNFESLEQDDERLIRYVRNRYLIPPSDKPYNFKNPGAQVKTEYSQWVRDFYKGKRGGVFIEAGANEGEVHSHTLDLEMDLGWSGILVECNPTVTPYLRSKHRKAWVAGVCVSTTPHPGVFNFSNPEDWTYSGRFGAAWNLPVKTNWTYFEVESVPLYSIIRAAGFSEIDYFSFDVEGAEIDILKTFPFDKILIKLLILEVYFYKAEEKMELQNFLQLNGLHLLKSVNYDQIYIHETMLYEYNGTSVV